MQLDRSALLITLAQLKHELKVDVCSLYLLNTEKTQLVLAATDGLSQSVIGSKLSIKQGLTGVVARTQKPLPVNKPYLHPDYFHVKGSNEEQFETYLGIPLVHERLLFGVLVVQTKRTKLFFLSDIQRTYAAAEQVMEHIILSPVKYATGG
jgi:L-methionine (R)-S-oxide reductase